MPKLSAGIVLYRKKKAGIEILLCHPGGPFYKKKDEGVWTIPKGEFEKDEEPLAAAKREFQEETGSTIEGKFIALPPMKYTDGRKIVYSWAVEGDLDVSTIKSNTFSLEWPPRSGRQMEIPEVDRAEWFGIDEARKKILPQLGRLIDELIGIL